MLQGKCDFIIMLRTGSYYLHKVKLKVFDFFLKIEAWNIEKLAFVCDYNGLYAEKYMFRKCKRWQISNAKAIFKDGKSR